MSNVIILWLSFIFIVEILRARFSEFCIFYWFSIFSCCFSMLFSFFAILYVGEFLLLITGLIGLSGLCIFIPAFSLGGTGFILSYVFYLFLDEYEVAFLQCVPYYFAIFVYWVFWYWVYFVFRYEAVCLLIVVLFIYDYNCFALSACVNIALPSVHTKTQKQNNITIPKGEK
jgi:hypothetical protein